MDDVTNRDRYIRTFHNDFGFSVRDLSIHYGMSQTVIANIVKPRTYAPVRNALSSFMPDAFASWVAGNSVNSLAKAYGCSRHALRHALEAYGCKFEPNLYRNFMRRRNHKQRQEKRHG